MCDVNPIDALFGSGVKSPRSDGSIGGTIAASPINQTLPGQTTYGDTLQARERARLQAMTEAGYRATFTSGPRGPGGPTQDDQTDQLTPGTDGEGSIDHKPRGGGPVGVENPPGSIDEKPRSTVGSGTQTPEMDPEEIMRRARRLAPYFGERRAWYEQ